MKNKEFIVSQTQKTIDMQLAPFDLWATKAHVLMLGKQKIIPRSTVQRILGVLEEVEKEYLAGDFEIDPTRGLHLTIEAKVIKKIGDDGYFMHTGRSRNDQVMTAEMLYLREKVLVVLHKVLMVLKVLIDNAEKNIETVMPGYTHMQPAKPTTLGQWCMCYFDMFVRVFDTLLHIVNLYNICPLGAVESYGTSWKIDRIFTAKLLGFTKPWEIPLDAISSRGFVQLEYMHALAACSIIVSKIAQDLMLFNTFEYRLIELSETQASQMDPLTGSSVMPQKKNPDVLELLRAQAPQIIGCESIAAHILSSLPTGYNRDTREVKEYMELAISKSQYMLEQLEEVLSFLVIKKEKMKQSVIDNYSLSGDLADHIAQITGIPYRKVYTLVGTLVKAKRSRMAPITSIDSKELTAAAKKLGLKVVISNSEIAKALDPVLAISRRVHAGGSAPEVMKQMIGRRKKLILRHTALIKDIWQMVMIAKSKTASQVQNVLKG